MNKPIYHEVKPLLVAGEYACFTRPELKAERVSYDVITPSAARGIVEAILWKPQISWRITRLHVLKEIMFVSLMRNEVSRKLSVGSVRNAYKTGDLSNLPIDPATVRVQRRDRILRDVEYVIEAEFRCTSKAGPDDLPQKYIGCSTEGRQKASAIIDLISAAGNFLLTLNCWRKCPSLLESCLATLVLVGCCTTCSMPETELPRHSITKRRFRTVSFGFLLRIVPR